MIDVNLGGLDLTGRWRVLEVEGWHDTPGFEVPSVERLRHGAISGRGRATGRTIKLAGRVLNTGYAEQAWDRDALTSLFRDGGMVPMTATVGGLTRSTDVQLIDRVTFQPTTVAYSRWELSLYAPDPHLYAAEQVTFLRAAETGIGLVYPLHSPSGALSYGSAIRGADPVVNAGNAEAWPVFLVVGDFPGGASITVGGRSVVWPWPITMSAPVEVRMSGSVWIGDANVTSRATRRDWSSIPPGGSISPEFAPLQGGAGWCEVHHRDTYI